MESRKQIIALYSELAEHPEKDFGWAKGRSNAEAHGYQGEWFDELPNKIWDYCAAVGNPFEQGEIRRGDTVVDLGCGAGVDLLVSALLTGDKGKAIGIDITPKMVAKAKAHAAMAGFSNVDVYQSDFETIPMEDESADIVISNGAINLTSCKESVFAEIYRILKPGGKLLFADIIDIAGDDEDACCSEGSVAPACCSKEKKPAETDACCTENSATEWANCVAGTLSKEKLVRIMEEAGFVDVACTGLTDYKTSETTTGATFKALKTTPEEQRKAHWEKVFRTKDYTQVLWHQSSPDLSLELIDAAGVAPDDAIIDVGCGASLLADHLIEKGYKNLTLLDVSSASLDIVKKRLGASADKLHYRCEDVTRFNSPYLFSLWHDRAVFHFLLHKEERRRYFEAMDRALKPGGIAVIMTFAIDGPMQCSGLNVVQYDAEKLKEELLPGLKLVESKAVIHHTPQETDQAFSCFIIRKT